MVQNKTRNKHTKSDIRHFSLSSCWVQAEKKQYEEYVDAQKKAVEDAVTKEKEFYEKVSSITPTCFWNLSL